MTKRFLSIIACVGGLVVVYFFIQSYQQHASTSKETTSSILNTNGVLHTVALEDILSGGLEKDDIPPLNDPHYISIAEANNVYTDFDTGVTLTYGQSERFYPLRILGWHQIINDTIGSKRILITYSPLTTSAVVFDPKVQGEDVLFGNTGLLWDSNLVLYDAKTESEWSQILSKAIVGAKSGEALEQIPSAVTTYGYWKKAHAKGEVLNIPEDKTYDYSRDPNQSYYDSETLYFPALHEDTRFSAKTIIIGITIHNAAKAYNVKTIKEKGRLTDTINGQSFHIQYTASTDTIRAYIENTNKQQTDLPLMRAYWFAWIGAYPNSAVYN